MAKKKGKTGKKYEKTAIKQISEALKLIDASIKLIKQIVEVLKIITYNIRFIIFILGILIWRVFLWEPLNELLNRGMKGWVGLSEGYKILILGLAGSLIVGTLSYIIGAMLLEKLKVYLKNRG